MHVYENCLTGYRNLPRNGTWKVKEIYERCCDRTVNLSCVVADIGPNEQPCVVQMTSLSVSVLCKCLSLCLSLLHDAKISF